MGRPGRSSATQSVRQRYSFIPTADDHEPSRSRHLEGSLFDSVGSVPLASGIKIARTSVGNSVFRVRQFSAREASVKKIDRMREKVTILPTSMSLSKIRDAVLSDASLEWEREVETTGTPEPQ